MRGKGGSHSAVDLFSPLQSLSRRQRPRRKSRERRRSRPISMGPRDVTGRSLHRGAWGGRGRRDPVLGSWCGVGGWGVSGGWGGRRAEGPRLPPHAPVWKVDLSQQSTAADGRTGGAGAWSLREGAVRLARIRRQPQGKGRNSVSSPVAFRSWSYTPTPRPQLSNTPSTQGGSGGLRMHRRA